MKAATGSSRRPAVGTVHGRRTLVVLIGFLLLLAIAITTTAPGSQSPRTFACALTKGAAACWDSHTGVEGATGYTEAQILAGEGGFRHVVGDVTITTPGTVIDHEWISGCVAVDASDVTIKDTLIASQSQCHGGGSNMTSPGQINTGSGPNAPTDLLVEDTTVDAQNSPDEDRAVGSENITCLRCNIQGASDNFTSSSNATVQDSYIHDPSTAPGPHEQSVNADTAINTTIRHSYITALHDNGYNTGAVYMGESWGNSSGLTITNSYLEGGSGADINIGCGNTNIQVTNSILSSDSSGYSIESGPGTFSWTTNDNLWKNNRDESHAIGGGGPTCS